MNAPNLLSSVNVLDIRTSMVQMETDPEASPNEEESSVTVGIGHEVRDDADNDRHFIVILHVGINASDDAFASQGIRIRMSVMGSIEVEEGAEMEADSLPFHATVSGLSILYGYVRAKVSTLSAETTQQRIMLPGVNMISYLQGHYEKAGLGNSE